MGRDLIGWTSDDYDFFVDVTERAHMRPEHLLGCMAAESELFSEAVNKDTGAAGLTQIMPFVLHNLGWNPGRPEYDEAKGYFHLAPVKVQLEYARRYFEDWRRRFGLGRWDTRVQLYLANLLPARIPIATGPEVAVLERVRWPAAYKVNAGLDRNRDGRITVSELDFFVESATTGRAKGQYMVAWEGLNAAYRRRGGYQALPIETTPMPPALRDVKDVRAIQRALTTLGYDVGKIDGLYGPRTRAAVMKYQTDHGLSADGWVGPFTLASISDALVREVPEAA